MVIIDVKVDLVAGRDFEIDSKSYSVTLGNMMIGHSTRMKNCIAVKDWIAKNIKNYNVIDKNNLGFVFSMSEEDAVVCKLKFPDFVSYRDIEYTIVIK